MKNIFKELKEKKQQKKLFDIKYRNRNPFYILKMKKQNFIK